MFASIKQPNVRRKIEDRKQKLNMMVMMMTRLSLLIDAVKKFEKEDYTMQIAVTGLLGKHLVNLKDFLNEFDMTCAP